ncbi:MAG TPA: 23S rRNA (adenine(2503)-C(2))-methyltransferase RlmN, partial [Candidatus Kapabacteria bacterium]|nr:23S rRNA (adenine(2503)-C(2))-methyltransferase RlmN [Candidatus Kapabacteria bacterium]
MKREVTFKHGKLELFGRTLDELKVLVKEEFPGVPGFRAEQLYKWMYTKRASSFAEMTDLPKAFIAQLEEKSYLPQIKMLHESVSEDGTRKFL